MPLPDLHLPAARLPRRRLLALLGSAPLGALAMERSADAAGTTPAPTRGATAERFLRAVTDGDLPLVNALLEGDPDLAVSRDGAGRSAYVIARVRGHDAVARRLLEEDMALDVVEAALAGAWERFDTLVDADPSLATQAHPIGGNPLYAAALANGSRLFHLRARGADSNARPAGGSGFTAARAAMDCADPRQAWLAAIDVLGNGGDVNALQAGGDSVLHGAVRRRDPRLVRLAVRKGARLDARDMAGRTAADLAVELAWEDGTALLADAAAIPRDHRASRLAWRADRSPFLWTPLVDVPAALQREITAVSHGRPDRVRELLGASPELVHAVSADAELAIEACGHTGHRENIRQHLDAGAPLALPTALSLGDLDHARWLLEQDPLLVHERGPHDIPLTWYVAFGGDDPAPLHLLLEFGADLEQESGGETLLHQAAWRDRAELTHELLRLGADATAIGHRQYPEGRTPHRVARERESEAVLAVFREAGIDA